MQLHHGKHHATYVANLNLAEEKLQDAVAKNDVSSVVGLHGALKFNGGGHINHSIFWQVWHSKILRTLKLRYPLRTCVRADLGSLAGRWPSSSSGTSEVRKRCRPS